MPDTHSFYTTEQLSENISKTPEGFLLCANVPLARLGEYIYRAGEVPIEAKDGVVKIQRDEEEVFREEAIKSFEGKPVTISHPNSAVTPENWSLLAHGTCQNVRRGQGNQSELLLGDLLITTEKAIELVNAGLREISLGYDAEYEEIESGLGRQKQICGNHIALVDKGRAGSICAINDKKTCDHCGTCKCGKDNKNKIEEDEGMSLKGKFLKVKRFMDAISPEDLKELEKEEKKEKMKDAEDLPIKLKAIKDTYDKWFKDVEEGKLDVSKLPVELEDVDVLDPKIKVTDEEGDVDYKGSVIRAEGDKFVIVGNTTKYDTLADAKDAVDKIASTIKDKKAKAKDRKTKDIDEVAAEVVAVAEDVEELKDQISTLIGTVEELVKSDEEVHVSMDKKMKDEEASEKAEEAEEEKKATADCKANWPDISSRVEILAPGMKISKPTKDYVKSLRTIKAEALKSAFSTDADVTKSFAKKDLAKLTNDALDAIFVGASEFISLKNNSKVQSRSIATGDFQAAVTVRDINKINKDFYNKKK